MSTTRIYLPYDLDPDPLLSPAFDPAWEKAGNYRYQCGPIKQMTGMGEVTNFETSATNPYDVGVVQFISPPLRAQTINGNVTGQILAREANAAANQGAAIVIRVLTEIGIVRGTLLSYFPGAIGTEFSDAGPINRTFPPSTALTEVVAEEGDRLCIELGFRAYNAATTSYAGYLTVGDDAAADLPADETETEYLNPWIEFDTSLQWVSETALSAGGFLSLSANSVLSGSGAVEDTTDLVADTSAYGTSIEVTGECAIDTMLPAQFAAAGCLGLSGPCAIDSIRSVIDFAAAGELVLSGPSILDLPVDLVTNLVAQGGMTLCGKSAIGGAEQLIVGIQTDFVATGSLRLCGSATLRAVQADELVTALVTTGCCFSLGGECALDFPVATVTALAGRISYVLEGMAASGVILPLTTAFVAKGGYVLGAPADETVFDAWVLNGQAFEPSIFSAFKFNSFAQRGAQAFAAGEDGIYLLGGDDDDGEAFHTGARIGPLNAGFDGEKRVRGIQMGNCGPDTKVKVAAEYGEGVFTPDIDSNRVVVSRNVQGRNFVIDIADFVELSHLEINILKLARR